MWHLWSIFSWKLFQLIEKFLQFCPFLQFISIFASCNSIQRHMTLKIQIKSLKFLIKIIDFTEKWPKSTGFYSISRKNRRNFPIFRPQSDAIFDGFSLVKSWSLRNRRNFPGWRNFWRCNNRGSTVLSILLHLSTLFQVSSFFKSDYVRIFDENPFMFEKTFIIHKFLRREREIDRYIKNDNKIL